MLFYSDLPNFPNLTPPFKQSFNSSSSTMALNPKSHLGVIFFTFFVFLASIPPPTVAGPEASTVYDILSQHGLPIGLLPDSVVDFSLSYDGRFVVRLAKPCSINFDYLVYYDNAITGKLNRGSITHLDGIQVQKLFVWLDVKEIRVDMPASDSIYFQVGIINKKLGIDQFKTVHSCRDNGLGSCWKRILELPTPVVDVPMLITE